MAASLVAATFETYLRVRDRVAPMRGLAPAADALSAAEQDVQATLQPLWDASPEMVAGLRRLVHVMTGVRASDYDDSAGGGNGPGARRALERQLRRLLKHGAPGLWVDEPLALGGFGWTGPVARYNADTLRFFRVISLLQEAEVLAEIREQPARVGIWEIGGWGGFAYQVKTLCPGVVYLTTGLPETLLVAAVYLSTLLPSARLRFFDPARPEAFWDDWQDVDFAFAPEGAWRQCPASIDVSVDLSMLARMTPGRVEAHVAGAHAAGSRYFLSICPPPSPSGTDASVLPTLARYYWRHPFSEPNYADRRLGLAAGPDGEPHSAFFLGWRRLVACTSKM